MNPALACKSGVNTGILPLHPAPFVKTSIDETTIIGFATINLSKGAGEQHENTKILNVTTNEHG